MENKNIVVDSLSGIIKYDPKLTLRNRIRLLNIIIINNMEVSRQSGKYYNFGDRHDS